MVDITSVGTAAFDVFLSVPFATTCRESGQRQIQFPLGSKVKVESVHLCCGGGAANTSVGFSRLGLTARFCGVVGSDEWGLSIQRTLGEEGVLLDSATIVEREVSNFSLIFNDPSTGERTILYTSNVSHHLRDPVFPKQLLRSSRWLFLNHLAEASCDILDDCLELLRDPAGPHFAWNPGGSQLRDGLEDPLMCALLRETDLLFLNVEEALCMMQEQSVEGAMRAGARAGVRVMCVTDAANGAALSDGRIVTRAPALATTVVDTTGAGDAFAVGTTWAVSCRCDLQTALKAGILNAASVIGKVGAQAGLLTEAEIQSRLETTPLLITTSSLL